MAVIARPISRPRMITANHTTSMSDMNRESDSIEELTWKGAFDRQADRQNCHQGLVSHGVNDRPDNSL